MLAVRRRLLSQHPISGAPPFSPAGTSGSVTASGGHFTVTGPPSIPDGAVILVYAESAVGPPTAPGGWATVQADAGAPFKWYAVFAKIAASEPSSWAFSVSSGQVGWSCCYFPGSAVNVSAHVHNVMTSPTVTTTVPGCQIVTLAGIDASSADTYTIDAACTVLTVLGAGVTFNTVIAYDTVAQASAGVTTARSVAASQSSNIVTVAIAP